MAHLCIFPSRNYMSFLCGLCSDESMLPCLLLLMYRMIDSHRLYCCSGNVAEDEGVSCRGNQLPRLFDVIVNILTKRPATDQVLEMFCYSETVVTVHSVFYYCHKKESASYEIILKVFRLKGFSEVVTHGRCKHRFD